MSLQLITPPAAVPISLAEVRAQLRVDDGTEDALLMAYVRSATDMVEQMSGLKLLEQVWDWSTDQFPPHCDWIRLPLAPLIAVEQITYLDPQGVGLTLLPETYLVRGVGSVQPARLILAPNKTWPNTLRGPAAITVRMRVGFGTDHNSSPESLRQSIGMLAAYWFSMREAAAIGPDYGPVSDVPFSVKQILEPYKLWSV
jgi:uncharacterized phiE125 gp8 family phage protein